MKKIYPAIFEIDPVGYGVYFPDVEGAVTQGSNEIEALENASDALGIMLADLIENGEPLPKPTPINEIEKENSTDIVTLISVDLNDYLRDTKLDKKTLKIPHWINVRATKEGINFSRVLTDALEQKLNV